MTSLRGYIFSRPFRSERAPQHVQNLVLRDYCQRHQAVYLLSSVEYRLPGSYLMLAQLLGDMADMDGLVFYSLRMLPDVRTARVALYNQVLTAGKSLHFAVEDQAIRQSSDIDRIEDILLTIDLQSVAVDPADL